MFALARHTLIAKSSPILEQHPRIGAFPGDRIELPGQLLCSSTLRERCL